MRCPHCGHETPEGDYCIHCGTQLPTHARRIDFQRRHAYAAYPREHVLHLSIITTLFPHLAPQQTQRARWLLFACAVVIFFVALGRLVPLAIVLALALLPLLYLAYFSFTQVYGDEPLPVLLGTFVSGAVLGVLLSVVVYPLILGQRRLGFGLSPGYALLTGLALPLLGQGLMLVGPLVLYVARPRFDHLLDGLVFGAASGLGFASAQSLIYSWLLLQGPFQQRGLAVSWALPVLRIALVLPLLNAATTALICGALWLRRDREAHAQDSHWIVVAPLAALVGVLGQVVPSLGYDFLGGQVMALVWYGGAAAVMLIFLRILVHDGLLERKASLHPDAPVTCPHCGRPVPPGAAFCGHCGFALGGRTTGRRRPQPEPEARAPGRDDQPSQEDTPPGPAAGEGGELP
jgi:RsiW-degrading membrane proteinase PrsW (M82 family)